MSWLAPGVLPSARWRLLPGGRDAALRGRPIEDRAALLAAGG